MPTQSVALHVTYRVASGDQMYPGDYDVWTPVKDGTGKWLLAGILADQGL